MRKLFEPQIQKLSNGLPVVFQHLDSTAAATYWWVKAGSADEKPGEYGFAHFLEHMLFKDAAAKESGRPSNGQMARSIESLGGDINAYTSFDQTVFHVTCAATHWERVIDQFGKIAEPQAFLKQDFDQEREVILEELKKNEDSPGRQFFQSIFSISFKKHPYGRPVIGFAKSLKAARVKELEAFYRRNYVPEKMGLVIVGPLESEKRKKNILAILEKRFGSKVLRAGSRSSEQKTGRSALVKAEQPIRKGVSSLVRSFDVQSPTLGLSFRMPELLHEDIPALDCVAGVLGMGEVSWLYQKLFYEKSLVTEVSGSLFVPKDPGMMYFQAEMDNSERILTVGDEILSIFDRLKKEGPSLEELSRIITNAESERLYATQSADGMAARLGFLQFIVGDLSFDEKYIARLRDIDADAVKEAASKYLAPERLNLVAMVSKEESDFSIKPLVEIAEKSLATSVKKTAATSKVKKQKDLLPVEMFTTPSGVRVAYLHRPQSHVFSVHSSVLAGVRMEAADQQGVSHLLSMTWTKGTPARDGKAIATLVEGRASSLDGFSGRNSMGLQLTGLQRDWDELSTLFNEVLLTPSFPDEEIEHSRRVVEDSIRSLEDHSGQICSKLFLEALYEKHPYGRMNHGTADTVARLNREILSQFHSDRVGSSNLVVSLSGPITRIKLQKWLDELDRASAGRSPGLSAPAPLDEAELKGPRWVERAMKREQDHIMVGGLGLKIQDEDRYPFRLLQSILGGQSGRLFIELREKKSLAYSVAPLSFEGMERGYVGTYIAASPQKRAEALLGMRKVLEVLAAKGPTAAELNRAMEFYLGRRAMDMQSDPTLAAHFGLELLYGIHPLTEEDVERRVRAVTAADVKRVCLKYLVKPHTVTSIVG